jgi:3-hydroxymyristoyl/3-hydroxydecanoyl-(acyl carrier protein) dehydratase
VADREWLAPLIQRLKRRPLVPEGTGVAVTHGRDAIERLLPHRWPMLLIDGIDIVDLTTDAVRGHREMRPADLGFEGHFPGEAIYPGLLLVETMGQLGLTLLHFSTRATADVPPTVTAPRVRATHVHFAAFLTSVRPGDRLDLHAQVVDSSYTTIAAGQAWKNRTLAAYAVSEVYVDE